MRGLELQQSIDDGSEPRRSCNESRRTSRVGSPCLDTRVEKMRRQGTKFRVRDVPKLVCDDHFLVVLEMHDVTATVLSGKAFCELTHVLAGSKRVDQVRFPAIRKDQFSSPGFPVGHDGKIRLAQAMESLGVGRYRDCR